MEHDFFSYRDGEYELEKEVAEKNSETFQLCVDVWNYLHSKLIRSVDAQIPLFMPFKQQVDIGCFCAITALSRFHGATYHQNLRYALENIAICIYHLVDPPGFSELFTKEASDRDEGDFVEKARKEGYKTMETKYSALNRAFCAEKNLTNTYGAHATLAAAFSNIKLGKDTCEINVFDTATPFVINARFMGVADIMLAFATSIIKEMWDPKMLLLYESAEEDLKALILRWQVIKDKIMREREHRALQNRKGKSRNQPCWCGSEIKQKKCHS